MRTVDKAGVHIDQCEGCRGIFLDRGELEQVASAETAYYESSPPPYQPEQRQHGHHGDSPRPHRGGYGDSPSPFRGGHKDSPRPYGRRRKKSFLDNLFD